MVPEVAAPAAPPKSQRSKTAESRKRRRAGGLEAGAAAAEGGAGDRHPLDRTRLVRHAVSAKRSAIEPSTAECDDTRASVQNAPIAYTMLGPRAVPCGTALPTRRLHIGDNPSSPTVDARRDCLQLLKDQPCPTSPPSNETVAEETIETWPPPPVRGRLAVRAQQTALQERRRRRLATSTPAVPSDKGVVIDYAHALRFVLRVKSACAPECFPAFLNILVEYHSGRRTVLQVYEQASELFAGQDRGAEVLQAFQEFLPR